MSANLGVRGFNPIWAEFDLTGKIFDDTYWMYTLQNTIPYNPQAVYHDPTLNTPWTDPIQFLANGTLPVDIYFLPNTFYRLEFRQNNGIDPPSQSDPLIYEVNNYIASGTGTTPVTNTANTSENQIANPQFSVVNFLSPTTITGTDPAPIEIAPGWFLELSGTGSVILNQVPLTSTTTNPTNAPYALRITLTGWNTEQTFLRQRFQQNGVLWANKTVSNAVTAKVGTGVAVLSANLVNSMGAPIGPILAVPVVNTSFQEFTGHLPLPASTDTDTPPNAYIDYKITLPNNADIYLTSIQLLVQDALNISEPTFVQDSVDRQIDHLFHYYNLPLQYKPIPSYLVGWDFPFNPAQRGFPGQTLSSTIPASNIGANKSKYVWDQTIIFQSTDSGIGVTRGTAGELLLTAAADTKMAIIQYLGPIEAKKILNAPICVNVSAKASTATTATVSLWYTKDAMLPNVVGGTNNSLVTSLDANGMATASNGTWFLVPRPNYPLENPQFVIGTNSTTNFNDYQLTGWDMQGVTDCNAATYFAIVIGTATVINPGTIGFNSVSLQSGSIATRPPASTYTETLVQCQHLFRKSFLPGVVPIDGIGLNNGESYGIQGGAVAGVGGPFIRFDTVMRKTPIIVRYNPAGATAGQIYDVSGVAEWSGSATTNVTGQGFATSGAPPSTAGHISALQWTADSRYGIVL